MQDKEFLAQFENCTLPKTSFRHRDHLRIVWLYLKNYPLNQAITHTSHGIRRYATSIGAAHIYHETLTRAWIYLVSEAMQQQSTSTFDDFIEKNPHLLDKTLPQTYYSSSLLDNDEARKTWVEPDLQPILNKARAALIWITEMLNNLHIPFQITGGLAALSYGSTRPLDDIDIDIPDDKFSLVQTEVAPFIEYGPERFKDESWDLLLMTLNYYGQAIDLSGADTTQICNKQTGVWSNLETDFSKVEMRNVLGLRLPVIDRDELLHYKKTIAREVDLLDIKAINHR